MFLPAPGKLEQLTRALATLDAILSEEWEDRYYSFNSKWAKGQRMASMRDGCGDEWFMVFGEAGVFLKGLAHERKAVPRDTIYAKLPAPLRGFLDEPSFSMNDSTYGAWCASKGTWRTGNDVAPKLAVDDGSAEHLAILAGKPAAYRQYAADYFEADVPLAAIRAIYAGKPLTRALLATIDPDRTLASLKSDLAEIGYGKLHD